MRELNQDQSCDTLPRDHLVFYLNGKRCLISDETANLTLADWLRQNQSKVGTKVVCNEGDCGACSVLLGKLEPGRSKLRYRAIDSCIAFLFQLDRTHIVTVEGLSVDGMLSPVQEAMVQCHGSQCGFCTPGFVTTMHGMIEALQPLDDATLRYGLSGNLCRCTGYLQIIQAGKSIDVSGIATLAELYPEDAMLQDFQSLGNAPVLVETNVGRTCIPSTLEQATQDRVRNPDATIVSGATDFGVLHNHGRVHPHDVICLSGLEALTEIRVEGDTLVIGAMATWIAIEEVVKELIPEYHKVLTRFGSPQIRQMGTIGGNLASGSPIADAVPLHLVLGTELELHSASGTRRIPLDDFYLGYRKTALQPDELITAIHTPLPKEDERLKLFKISKRRDMDISTMTFAIWAAVEDGMIRDVRIAVGGVGPTVMRLTEAEQALVGKLWTEETFQAVGKIAKQSVSPWNDVRGSASYRAALTENLLVKCFHDATE